MNVHPPRHCTTCTSRQFTTGVGPSQYSGDIWHIPYFRWLVDGLACCLGLLVHSPVIQSMISLHRGLWNSASLNLKTPEVWISSAALSPKQILCFSRWSLQNAAHEASCGGECFGSVRSGAGFEGTTEAEVWEPEKAKDCWADVQISEKQASFLWLEGTSAPTICHKCYPALAKGSWNSEDPRELGSSCAVCTLCM